MLTKRLGGIKNISRLRNEQPTTSTIIIMTPETQTLLFSEAEIGTTEKTPSTTFKDLLRELISLGIEVDIAVDQIIEGEHERAKNTLEELQERLEEFISNIK